MTSLVRIIPNCNRIVENMTGSCMFDIYREDTAVSTTTFEQPDTCLYFVCCKYWIN